MLLKKKALFLIIMIRDRASWASKKFVSLRRIHELMAHLCAYGVFCVSIAPLTQYVKLFFITWICPHLVLGHLISIFISLLPRSTKNNFLHFSHLISTLFITPLLHCLLTYHYQIIHYKPDALLQRQIIAQGGIVGGLYGQDSYTVGILAALKG